MLFVCLIFIALKNTEKFIIFIVGSTDNVAGRLAFRLALTNEQCRKAKDSHPCECIERSLKLWRLLMNVLGSCGRLRRFR